MTSVETFAEALEWLGARGVESAHATRGHGLEGRWRDGQRVYLFRLRCDHDGGIETAVTPDPGALVWWIHAQTMDEMLNMLVDAQADVDAGRAPTWLDALKAKDPLRWMDPDYKKSE